jgi:hypothetical protein
MQGFIVFDYMKEYAAARKQLTEWLAEGKLKRQETIIKGGLKVAEEAFANLFTGSNIGKIKIPPSRTTAWLTMNRQVAGGSQEPGRGPEVVGHKITQSMSTRGETACEHKMLDRIPWW